MYERGPFYRYTPVIPELSDDASQEEKDAAVKLAGYMEQTNLFYRCDNDDPWYKQDWYLVQDDYFVLQSSGKTCVMYDEAGKVYYEQAQILFLNPENLYVALADLPTNGTQGDLRQLTYIDGVLSYHDASEAEMIFAVEQTRMNNVYGVIAQVNQLCETLALLQQHSSAGAEIARTQLELHTRYLNDFLNMKIVSNPLWPQRPNK